MKIKEVINESHWRDLLSIISNREEIIKALEKEKRKIERSSKNAKSGDILHYSILINAIQYFEEMTDEEAYTIKKRIQAKAV
jgi:hypothetical protein